MNLFQRIFKNTFMLAFTKVVNSGISLVLFLYLANYFGVSTYGEWAFSLSFTSFFLIFIDWGFFNLLIKDVSRNKSLLEQYFNNILFMKLFFVMICILIMFLIGVFSSWSSQLSLVIFILSISLIFSVSSKVFYSVFQAFERMEFLSFSRILMNLFFVLVSIVCLISGAGIIIIALVFLVAMIFEFILNLIIYSKYFPKFNFKINFLFCKKLFKKSLPLFLMISFGFLFFRISLICLQYLDSSFSTGIFSVSSRIVLYLTSFILFFNSAMFPAMSNMFNLSHKKFKFFYNKSLKLVSLFSIPSGLILFFLSDKIVNLFLGSEYEGSVIVLKILSLAFILSSFRLVNFYLLISIEKQWFVNKLFLLSAVILVILNIVLIPLFQSVGAAISILLVEVFSTLVLLFKKNSLISKRGLINEK